jgi:hypothetical protein
MTEVGWSMLLHGPKIQAAVQSFDWDPLSFAVFTIPRADARYQRTCLVYGQTGLCFVTRFQKPVVNQFISILDITKITRAHSGL